MAHPGIASQETCHMAHPGIASHGIIHACISVPLLAGQLRSLSGTNGRRWQGRYVGIAPKKSPLLDHEHIQLGVPGIDCVKTYSCEASRKTSCWVQACREDSCASAWHGLTAVCPCKLLGLVAF